MITIKNTQRSHVLNIPQIRRTLSAILTTLDYADFDIGVWFTTDRTIRYYNRTYRSKDKPTDILSFPFYPELKAGKRITATDEEEKNLGDLIISVAYVTRAAEKLNVNFDSHLTMLLVHGICHLLGYDHEKDTDYRVMRRKEEAILRSLKK
ncbi:MAG: rRNA maturation RNase YbeY [Candidatus Babeliales bacterium]